MKQSSLDLHSSGGFIRLRQIGEKVRVTFPDKTIAYVVGRQLSDETAREIVFATGHKYGDYLNA